MSVKANIVRLAEGFVSELFSGHDINFHYHNLGHTKLVVKYCKQISNKYKLTALQYEKLLLAAWFHDVGVEKDYQNHEVVGAEIAFNFLIKNNYNKKSAEAVAKLIVATRITSPYHKNILERILRDADVAYIGTNNFSEWSLRLRHEWEWKFNKTYTNDEWRKSNIQFLNVHTFNTRYAQAIFGKKKNENLLMLKAATY